MDTSQLSVLKVSSKLSNLHCLYDKESIPHFQGNTSKNVLKCDYDCTKSY